MANNVDKKSAAPAAPRTAPISPKDVQPLEHESRRWQIRLPQGVGAQDIVDHPDELWKSIQSNPNVALRNFDEVRMIDYAESQVIDATVGFADHGSVVLSGIRRFDMPSRNDMLYSDDTYQVEWGGNGYIITRRMDGTRMLAESFERPEQAKLALISQLYPRRSAA